MFSEYKTKRSAHGQSAEPPGFSGGFFFKKLSLFYYFANITG